MRVIVYKSKHGSTRKIAKVIDAYIEDCLLMDLDELDYGVLEKADIIVCGAPIYYGKLNEEMVSFIKENQTLLKKKKYCLYVTGMLYSEFMSAVADSLDYNILRDIKVIAGLGGVIYYPDLSLSERVGLNAFNKVNPVIPKNHDKTIYENFNNDEIYLFAHKIEKLDNKEED